MNYGSSGYPLNIPNGSYDYSNPCYIGDLNGNGSVELALAAGTEKLWLVEIGSSSPTYYEQNLSSSIDPSSSYSWNLGTSMLTAVDQGGNRYLVGSARHLVDLVPPTGNWLMYCFRLNSNLTGSVAWTRGDGGALTPGTSYDHWGNFGGLAVGDLSSSSGLEIVQQWDRCIETTPDIVQSVRSYSLSNGYELSSLETVRNPHQEDPCFGPVVTSGSVGGYNAAFFGYSNLGHAVRMKAGNLEYIAGFPYWTEDLGLSAPVVADMDGDDLAEVLMVDDSGLMQLFDWNATAGSGGWPTFQHDNWRTGFYGTSVPACVGSAPDISISLAELADIDETARGETTALVERYLRVLVEIKGIPEETAASQAEQSEQAAVPRSSIASAPVFSSVEASAISEAAPVPTRTVEVAVLTSDGSVLGRIRIRLENGVHEVRIPLSAETADGTRIAVAADPSNEVAEADEGNNAFALDNVPGRGGSIVEGITSRDGRVIVALAPQSIGSAAEASVRLYSLDGRLVEQASVEAGTGLQVALPASGDALPAGCYMVVVEQGDMEVTQKVVVLR